MIKLYTERLLIRDPILNDLLDYHELISNDKAMIFWQDNKTNNIEETKEKLLLAIEQSKSVDRKNYFLKIFDKNTNNYIGEIGYKVIENTSFGKIVSLSYGIKEKYWNNGYTTEAVKRIIKFGFEENDVYRFMAGCLKENIGSEKVMINCNLIKEAEFKELVPYNGILKDSVEYRLLKHEWNDL